VDAAQRRLARAAWPIRRTRLGDDESPVVDATPSERVAMVHVLTMDAWAMSGQPLPDYARSAAPGRIVRR
jgi:hypothetical protein